MKMPSSSRVIKGSKIGSIEDTTLKPIVVHPLAAQEDGEGEGGLDGADGQGPAGRTGRAPKKKDPLLAVREEEAKNLINEAERARADLLKGAHEEARSIKEAAYQEGLKAGRKEGIRQGLEERRRENADFQDKLAAAWGSLKKRFLELEEEYEEEIVLLAVQTASVFLEETTDPERLTAQIRRVLETLVRERNITVYVHPDHYPAIKEALGREGEEAAGQLVLAQDPSLAPTDFTCETSESCVRFSPKQKLERLLAELLDLHKIGKTL